MTEDLCQCLQKIFTQILLSGDYPTPLFIQSPTDEGLAPGTVVWGPEVAVLPGILVPTSQKDLRRVESRAWHPQCAQDLWSGALGSAAWRVPLLGSWAQCYPAESEP